MPHNKYMQRCFELARKGYGKVSPNPLVGAVIVKNSEIISEGYHEYFGGLHAEANAIKNSDEDLAGATIYCNLEPCCHTNKKTPPCTPAIISAGIKKVVISNVDPNPMVAGKGINQLHDAGIEVITGVLEEEGAELNKFFFKSVTQNRPYITLKIAQSLDGYISESADKQTWLTNKDSKKEVHKLRNIYDAVLIGANTANIDNPSLTVRECEGRNPIRIILDGKLSVNPDKSIFNDNVAKTIIITTSAAPQNKIEQFKTQNVIIEYAENCKDGIIDPNALINVLNRYKINSLLVEGGAGIFTWFADKKLFDEIIVFIAPKILGNGIKAFKFGYNFNLDLTKFTNLNSDLRIVYKR